MRGSGSRRGPASGRQLLLSGLVAVATVVVGLVVVPHPAAPAVAPLDPVPVGHVTGTDGRVYMADSQGRAVQFRGFNTGKDMEADVAEITPELMAIAVDRGFNLMRLAYHWHKLEPADDDFDDAYVAQIIAALDLAEEYGVSVILDNHQDIFGPRFGGGGVPEWATDDDGLPFVYDPDVPWFVNYLQPAVQAAWENLYEDPDRRAEQIDGFMYLVERVAGHPALIGYDLLNEPFGKMRDGETLITAAARVEATQITPMYQRLTDAIRTVDRDSWIFVEPPNLASLGVRTNLGRIDDDKVVVYPHLYDIGLESGSTYDPESPFLTNYEAVITHYPETYDVPMMIGEWGLPDPGIGNADLYVGRALAMLERVASGWTHFTWCKGGGYCALDGSGELHPTWQLLVQAWPRAIAGAPTASNWDEAARSLRVTYRDREGSSGPTEIVVPPSLFGSGGFVVESSAPAGEWSYSYDEATARLTVEVPHQPGADRAICVSPAGISGGCTVEAPPVEPPAEPPTEPPAAPPADPIATEADFTG